MPTQPTQPTRRRDDEDKLRRQRLTAQQLGKTVGTTANQAISQFGPWGALGAAIVANESAGRAQNRRPKDQSTHLRKLATGEVLEHDLAEVMDDDLARYLAMMSNPFSLIRGLT